MTVDLQELVFEVPKDLDEPNWLADMRQRALGRLTSVSPATERSEDWRYGRIDELDLARYPLSAQASPAPMGERAARFVEGLDDAVIVHLVDGALIDVRAGHAGLPNGVRVERASARAARPGGFGSLLERVDEPFAVLCESLCREPLLIDIAPHATISQPVVVVSELTGQSAGQLSFSWLSLSIGAQAQATVVLFQSGGDEERLHVPVTELFVADGARLSFDAIQDLGDHSWQLGYELVEVGRDGLFSSFAASLGAEYSRLHMRAMLAGTGAESNLYAAYLGVGSQTQEFRTFQDHLVGHTKSELVFKGAVADRARSVYSGMVHMRKGARRAEASQTNRNLVLDEGARADSVPNLDIEENDVRCSHASAVGPIDPEQRYYLESRGVPPEVAERLILLGFFEDLLAKAHLHRSADHVREVVATRLSLSPAMLGAL